MYKISTLGSHSALDVCEGAKQEGFKTVVACEKGREKTYLHHSTRIRGGKEIGIIDNAILLNKFSDIIDRQKEIHESIFVPNRSFAVYIGYDKIEKEFNIPVFGNKFLLRAEERDAKKNQYYLMEKAGIRTPQKFNDPKKIDKLSIVKVNEAKRTYERAFFLVKDYAEYIEKSTNLIKSGKINEIDLKKATIEEYVIGAHFNFNFFYSPIYEELELLGIDTRRQTNIEGYLKMPADSQLELLKLEKPSTIEVGHIACTLRESLLEQAYELGERFVRSCEKEYKFGVIGPFALQGAIVENDKEEFVCFDISLRIPGSPGTRFTPYSGYIHRENISFGRRIAQEIKVAGKNIEKITT